MTINGALVLTALKACNGYVYVIDKILNPKDLIPENDELEIINRNDLTIVKRIFDALGFTPVNIFCEFNISIFSYWILLFILLLFKKKVRPETIFAPTDAAFAALPSGFLESLLADKKKLFDVIRNHIVTGYQYSRGLETGPILTISGAIVDVKVSPSELHFLS